MGVDRVVVVSNPNAGRGGASGIAGGVCAAIGRSGREAVLVETGGEGSLSDAIHAAIQKPTKVSSGSGSKSGGSKALSGGHGGGGSRGGTGEARSAQAIVVCGGDGTVHAVVGVAHETGTPIYHMPMGTENLFAREFGMTRGIDRLIDALDGGRVERVDLARCNGELFVLMCSVGPDASVIHRLDGARTGPITHSSYTQHIVKELMRPNVARVRVEVDGKEVVPEQFGMVVVANSRQYGIRIDPAYGADMRDGLLDVVFLPAKGRARMMMWLVLARIRALHWGGGAVRVRGKRVVIESDGAPRCQIDGEAAKHGEGEKWKLEMEVVPGGLGVVVGEGKKSVKRKT